MTYQVDAGKTNDVIAKLKEDGLTVGMEQLDKYLQESGVLVKVHVGRIRNSVELSPKMFGVDVEKSEELKNFFKDYVKNGKLSFLPSAYENNLKKIESRVRMKKMRLAIGMDGEYMQIDTYKDYVEYVKQARIEYFGLRDEIILHWDKIIDMFKTSLKHSLGEMNALQKEIFIDSIMESIPTKKKYFDSFYMYTTVRAFPVMANVNIFDEDIAKEIAESSRNDVVQNVYEIIGNTLAKAFDITNSLYNSFEKNRKISGKTIGSAIECAKNLKKQNIFNNKVIDKIADNMNDTANCKHVDDIAEKCEDLLALIFGYAKELSLESHISLKNSMLTEEELTLLYV